MLRNTERAIVRRIRTEQAGRQIIRKHVMVTVLLLLLYVIRAMTFFVFIRFD